MSVLLSDTFSHCVYCGGNLTLRHGSEYICSACNKKSYLAPALGCNCILLDNEKVLMTQRARNPDAGTWSLPGGFAEPYESCEETMIREAMEELCVTITVDTLIGSNHFTYIYQDIARPIVVVYGVGTIKSGEIVCCDDVSDYRWLTLEEVKTLSLYHEFEVEMISRAFQHMNHR